MFYLAGISIAFFLSLMLFTKKHRNAADVILAGWLCVVGIHLFFYYAGITNIIYEYPWMLGIHLPLPLLHGPFLYLYARTQTRLQQKLKPRDLLHFLPAIADYLYLIHFFVLSNPEKILVYQQHGQAYPVYLPLNFGIIVISGIYYVIASLLLIRQHQKNIQQEFSATERINLLWIQKLVIGLSIIWVLVIFGNDNLVFSASVLFVLFIGFYGIRQEGVFLSQPPSPAIANEVIPNIPDDVPEIPPLVRTETEEKTTAKYLKSGLTESQKNEIKDALNAFIANTPVYTQCDLTLTHLANLLKIHPNHLSQVLNETEGRNFYDYINTLRVHYFIGLMSQEKNKQKTLLALALESGFNSKSTFNKYFKKVTGVAPSEFQYTEKNTSYTSSPL